MKCLLVNMLGYVIVFLIGVLVGVLVSGMLGYYRLV